MHAARVLHAVARRAILIYENEIFFYDLEMNSLNFNNHKRK